MALGTSDSRTGAATTSVFNKITSWRLLVGVPLRACPPDIDQPSRNKDKNHGRGPTISH